MPIRFNMAKYFCGVLILFLVTSCVSAPKTAENSTYKNDCVLTLTNNDYKIFIATIEWVKLYPNETPQNTTPDSDGVITVTNSCGKAEIKYKTNEGTHITAWMRMGEWCRNPFDNSSAEQFIVVSKDNNYLVEYHPILKTDKMVDVIVVLYSNSILQDYIKPLSEPVLLFFAEEGKNYWVDQRFAEKHGDGIYAVKGVYLSDVIKCDN